MEDPPKLRSMSHEAQLASMQISQQHIVDTLRRIENSVQALEKAGQDSAIQAVEMTLRITSLEHSMTANAPTIQEFVTIKHKVQGAGKMGTVLWACGAALLTLLATSREAIFGWLSNS